MQQTDRRTLKVVDLTAEQTDFLSCEPPHHKLTRDRKLKQMVVFCRDPMTVDGIVLHQTATPFGTTPQQIAASGGDKVLAKHRRALNVAAHITAFDTGYAVLAHPLHWYVYHANGLNARSLGIEVEGVFPGSMGKKELLTGDLLQAAKDGLEYLVRKGREAGMPIKYIWAHRQSSMTRPNDPGEEIWKKIALEFGGNELQLIPQPDYILGGESLPQEWRLKKPGAR
jgi:hypothetical protein